MIGEGHERSRGVIVEKPSPTPSTAQRLIQKSVPSKNDGLLEFLKLKSPSFTGYSGSEDPFFWLGWGGEKT